MPVLWDKQRATIVSNESSEIIRMFNSAFNGITGDTQDFYPKALRPEIDAVNDRIYSDINNGVYKSGFATSQAAYDEAVTTLFDALDWVETRLGTQPGAPLSIEQLRDDLGRIYGLGLFERVGYQWVESDDGAGIVIDAQAKSWGPGYLRFGLGVEEDFEGSGNIVISARYLRTAINRLGAEWRNDATFGTRFAFESEFYQPLDFNLRYFVAPQLTLEQRNIDVFEGDDRMGRYRLSTGELGLFAGRESSNGGEVRRGIFRG